MGLQKVLRKIDEIEDIYGKPGTLVNTTVMRHLFVAFAEPDDETVFQKASKPVAAKPRAASSGKPNLDVWMSAEDARIQGLSIEGRKTSNKTGTILYGFSKEADGAKWPPREPETE